MRRLAVLAIVTLAGCCLDVSTPAAPTSVAIATPSVDEGCLDLCRRIADCDTAEGRMPVAPDCDRECTNGGVYASLGATELHCALEPDCARVRQCAGPALAVTLLGSIATAEPTTAPPDWPATFPTLPGGLPRPVPRMGPVRVALIAYPSRDIANVERDLRDALATASWTVTDAPTGDGEAHRFVAEHEGESVSVSIYRDGTDTLVQTMQLGE